MTFFEILFSAPVLAALTVHGIMTMIIMLLTDRLAAHLEHHALQDAVLKYVVIPLSKVISLLLFIGIAYPTLYGIETVPSLVSILTQDELRIQHLINLLFITSLILLWLPLSVLWHSLLLPIQGSLAAGLLFFWMAKAQGIDITLWPSWEALFAMIIWALLSHWITVKLSFMMHELLKNKHAMDDGEIWFYQSTVLTIQVPTILIYASSLGAQWPAQ